jgi:hypothetical protein
MAIGTAAAIALGVGALGSAAIGASAASKAGKAQVAAADKGVEEQRAAREEMRRLLEPYVAAGGPALEAQMGALGLRGTEAQQAYVAEQEQSPIFQALASASKKNPFYRTPQQLADFVAATFKVHWLSSALHCLTSFLTQQYGNRLGGMTALGQQSAAGVGTAGMQSAGAIADLFGQAGAARAGSALGVGQALSGPFNLLSTLGGMSASKSMGYAPPVQPRGF